MLCVDYLAEQVFQFTGVFVIREQEQLKIQLLFRFTFENLFASIFRLIVRIENDKIGSAAVSIFCKLVYVQLELIFSSCCNQIIFPANSKAVLKLNIIRKKLFIGVAFNE